MTDQCWSRAKMVRTHLPRKEATLIHAMLDASVQMAVGLSLFSFALLWFAGLDAASLCVALAWVMAAGSIGLAITTDLKSMRIPNGLSGLLLLAGALRWAGELLGADRHANGPHGVSGDVFGWLLGNPSGPFVPVIPSGSLGASIALDVATMLLVFLPTWGSFALRLGFGGGDVKLMSSAALYFGWSLGVEFLLVTYLFGLVMSVALVAGRFMARRHPKGRIPGTMIASLATMNSFPYAPAIALSAAACLATHLEGLI